MSSFTRRDSDILESPSSSSQQRPRYPFLQHETQQRQSTGSLPKLRRLSTTSIASTASSIGGALDSALQHAPALNDLHQNAISSLLSHPIVRTGLVPQSALIIPSAHRPPSARDIPPVNLTPIPQVEAAAFRHYLAKVGTLFDSYQRSKQEKDVTAATPFQRPEREGPTSDYFGTQVQTSQTALSPALLRTSTGLSSPISSFQGRRPSGATGTPRRDKSVPTPLSTIPNVYFEENFKLENPRTFDVVSERSDVVPPDPQSSRNESKEANGSVKAPTTIKRKALHTNAILQEKLSWYMDTVEIHLISSIATASSSFFAALGSLKDLQSEATDSISKIKGLREALQDLDMEIAMGGLEVLNMRRRRENLRRLANAVSQLCEVMEEAVRCEGLVDEGKFEEADTQIDALEDLIEGSNPSIVDRNRSLRIDLRQLKALDGISEGILQLRQRIGKGYESRFIEALLLDLRKHVESVPPRDTLQRWAKASFRSRGDHGQAKSALPAYLNTNEQLRPDLLKALAGLNKVGHTARAATAYREAIMREIKSLIRRHLPSSSDDDAESVTSISTSLSTLGGRRLNQQEKSSILARNLRSLDADSAEELLIKVYTSVGEALRRMGVQVKVVLDVTSSLEQPTEFPTRFSSLTPSSEPNQIREEVTQALDMSSLLGQAVDVIQTQVTKVLKVRNEQNARLPLPQFVRYFTLNRLFTDECEAVSSRGGEVLKDAVNAQVKEFLPIFADAERQRIMQTLETDRWDAKDFGPSDAVVLDRILESMNQTPKAWTEHTQILEESPLPVLTNGTTLANGDSVSRLSTGNTSTTKTRPAIIDEQPYFLVQSTLSALYGIDSFLNLAAAIPSLTIDCSLKLLECLKAFNSLSCQLILGAGATRSAGLKNITSKHLALASQTCSFLVALVPYIREFVRRQAGGNVGNVFIEFDKVKRLLQDHQSSIHEKLVDIMSQRCTAHINAMKMIEWDSPESPESQSAVSPYVEALTKETGTLHRVLGRHVAEMDMKMIMTPIFAHYSQEWSKAFREAVVRTETGKAKMLRDVEFLDAKLSKIDGSAELGANLVQLVKDKRVEKLPEPKQTPRLGVTRAAEIEVKVDSEKKETPPATKEVPSEAKEAPSGPKQALSEAKENLSGAKEALSEAKENLSDAKGALSDTKEAPAKAEADPASLVAAVPEADPPEAPTEHPASLARYHPDDRPSEQVNGTQFAQVQLQEEKPRKEEPSSTDASIAQVVNTPVESEADAAAVIFSNEEDKKPVQENL